MARCKELGKHNINTTESSEYDAFVITVNKLKSLLGSVCAGVRVFFVVVEEFQIDVDKALSYWKSHLCQAATVGSLSKTLNHPTKKSWGNFFPNNVLNLAGMSLYASRLWAFLSLVYCWFSLVRPS